MREHALRGSSPFEGYMNDFCGSLVFVGSSLFFPDSLIRFVRAEFGTVRTLRVPGRRGLKELVAVDGPPRLCVVEERFADDLEEELDLVADASDGAMVSLAYYRPEIARRLVAREQESGAYRLGYVPMHAHLDVWLASLRIQLCGERYVPSELLSALHADLPNASGKGLRRTATARPPHQPPETPLTERELQVLELVSDGKQNKSIADELGVSEHTVKLHVHNVLTKLKVRNRTGATTWYVRQRDSPAIQGGSGV